MKAQKFISCYEIDDNHIREMLGSDDIQQKRNSGGNIISRLSYRENQIKLIYALLNLNRPEDVDFVHKILKKLTKYEAMEEFEVNFIIYLWHSGRYIVIHDLI